MFAQQHGVSSIDSHHRFFIVNGIPSVLHSLQSSYRAPFDFQYVVNLQWPREDIRYSNILGIRKEFANPLGAMPATDLMKSINKSLGRATHGIEARRDDFAKKTDILVVLTFIMVLFTLRHTLVRELIKIAIEDCGQVLIFSICQKKCLESHQHTFSVFLGVNFR